MLTNNINARLVLSMSYLLHTAQELFCDDSKKRENALREFRLGRLQLVRGFTYILKQAEDFHRRKSSKGGVATRNSCAVPMETK